MASRSRSRALTDHEEIRQWAEQRGAKPAAVRGTERGDETGIIRLDFPGYGGGDSLEEIDWDEWFQKFDENNLALLVQDQTAGGQKSNFNKLVSRATAEQGGRGSHRGTSRRASSGSRSRTRARGAGARSSSRSSGSRSTSRGRSASSSRGNRSRSASSRSRSGSSSKTSRSRSASSSSRRRKASSTSRAGSTRRRSAGARAGGSQSRSRRSRTSSRSSRGSNVRSITSQSNRSRGNNRGGKKKTAVTVIASGRVQVKRRKAA